jgi:hypothetical protein
MPLEKYSCSKIYLNASIKFGDDDKTPLKISIENNEKNTRKYYLIWREPSGPRLFRDDSVEPTSPTLIAEDNYLEGKIQFLGKVTIYRGKEKVREFPRFSDFFEAIEK